MHNIIKINKLMDNFRSFLFISVYIEFSKITAGNVVLVSLKQKHKVGADAGKGVNI